MSLSRTLIDFLLTLSPSFTVDANENRIHALRLSDGAVVFPSENVVEQKLGILKIQWPGTSHRISSIHGPVFCQSEVQRYASLNNTIGNPKEAIQAFEYLTILLRHAVVQTHNETSQPLFRQETILCTELVPA